MSPSLDEVLDNFRKFCRVDLALSQRTVESHIKIARAVVRKMDKHPQYLDVEDVRNYLSWLREARSPKTYSNQLGTLKRFFRDFMDKPEIVNSFRFPAIGGKAKVIPDNGELQTFFKALPIYGQFQGIDLEPRYQAFFLLVASSGLRFCEASTLKKKNILKSKRMIISECHETYNTKKSWITFYNSECEKYLNWIDNLDEDEEIFPCTRSLREAFWKAEKLTRIHITPQVLREWFCCEMGRLGVQDRYVDAFCGRVPQSVLARHYTDYSPDRLKEIYDKADIRILS